MEASQVELAAHNNAVWCDTVCRAHGTPGEFFPTVWRHRGTPPPFYSNLVVISDSHSQDITLDHIRDLMDLPLPERWSVKDSFFNLELEALGFDILFEASWIWRDPRARNASSPSAGIRWSRVASSAGLAQWEAAWSADSRNAEATGRSSQFPDSLRADPRIAFFAGFQGRRIVAGGIANRTDRVVGLSNVFANSVDASPAWAGLVDMVQDAFPDLPLVGYEHDIALEAALVCGFRPIGPLRVWLRQVNLRSPQSPRPR